MKNRAKRRTRGASEKKINAMRRRMIPPSLRDGARRRNNVQGLREGPADTVDTAVTVGCDSLEETVGEIKGAFHAFWASVDDLSRVGCTIVGDIDGFSAERVGIGVDPVVHIGCGERNKSLAI